MTKEKEQMWVFRANLLDRIGALTSVSSAFSNEGISIDTVVGYGSANDTASQGSVIITFRSTTTQKDIMFRKIKRLSKVTDLHQQPYDSRNLWKSAVILSRRQIDLEKLIGKNSGLLGRLIKSGTSDYTYFLAGKTADLDSALKPLKTKALIKDVTYSVFCL